MDGQYGLYKIILMDVPIVLQFHQYVKYTNYCNIVVIKETNILLIRVCSRKMPIILLHTSNAHKCWVSELHIHSLLLPLQVLGSWGNFINFQELCDWNLVLEPSHRDRYSWLPNPEGKLGRVLQNHFFGGHAFLHVVHSTKLGTQYAISSQSH